MSRGEPYGKLAPCAFCGGKATLAPMPGTRGWWQVRCRAYLCGGTTWDMSEVELAVDAWNRRHRCIVAFRRPTVRQQGLLEAGAGGLGRIQVGPAAPAGQHVAQQTERLVLRARHCAAAKADLSSGICPTSVAECLQQPTLAQARLGHDSEGQQPRFGLQADQGLLQRAQLVASSVDARACCAGATWMLSCRPCRQWSIHVAGPGSRQGNGRASDLRTTRPTPRNTLLRPRPTPD